MKYSDIVFAEFLERPNRFIAKVRIEGSRTIETVHVKNTGRCRELLIPGAEVALEKAGNPDRKTAYDLVAVVKDGLGWVNIDSQAPNILVREWLEDGKFPDGELTLIRPEYRYGNSRIDFYCEAENGKRRIFMEVKGCTLEIDGQGYFPDAPSDRAVKHLNELAAAVSEGYECYLAYAITMPEVRTVKPNIKTHPQYGQALDEAIRAGVKVLFLPCEVEPDKLRII